MALEQAQLRRQLQLQLQLQRGRGRLLHCTALHCACNRNRGGGPGPRLRWPWCTFVLSGTTVFLVAASVINLGSLTAQCRQRVNTPCRMPLHALAYMDVQKTFFDSFLASTKKEFACRGETRPGGSQPHCQ
jgi:hypothetical protein